MKNLFSNILKAGIIKSERALFKKVLSSVLAVTVVFTPITPALVLMADEIQPEEKTEEITESTEELIQETDVVPALETDVVTKCSEYDSEEITTVIIEDDLITSDSTETIDATAPPMEQETESTVAEPATTEKTDCTETETTELIVGEKTSNIVSAKSADEYYKLISSLSDDYQRIIVDTYADLTELEGVSGVYYDGTYILDFDDSDTYTNAVKVIHDAGYEYAIDGTLCVCGNVEGVISYGALNQNANVRVAVIDTGSNLANEKYSVIGDDVADNNGHGTAMSSLILDETSNAYIISIKAIDDNGQGQISDVYAAVQLAEDMDVDYILMAVSIRNSGKYDAFISLIENTNATVIASAGNNGTDASKYLPAGIDSVITVGAVNESDLVLKSFSNYGTCVEYYVDADSTSEASAIALGKIVAGETSKLITVATNIDAGIHYWEGSEYYFDINSTFGNSNESLRVGGGAASGFIYVLDGEHFHDAYADFGSDTAYCLESDRGNPRGDSYYGDTETYNGNDVADDYRYLQAALAMGPGGGLDDLSIVWWRNYSASHPDADSSQFLGQSWYYCQNDYSYGNRNWSEYTPDFSSKNWKSGFALYLITHMAADYFYGGRDIWPGGTFGTAMSDYIKYIKSLRDGNEPESSRITDWELTVYKTDVTDSNNIHVQYMGVGNAKLSSQKEISLTKTSSDPSVTDGNSCYSLAGTTYGLFSDSSCINKVATFIVDASGKTATTYKADYGKTYYLKEISAGKGYKLDGKTYTVTIAANGDVSVNYGAATTVTGNITYIRVTDEPNRDPLNINLRKIDKNGNVIHNADCAGSVFRFYYYSQDLGESGNTSVTPTVVYDVTISTDSIVITLPMLRSLTPVGGDNQNYLKNLPSDWTQFPHGTVRVQEIKAPIGYRINDQILRYRLGQTGANRFPIIENNSSYGNQNYWKQQQDGSWDLVELPEVGFYSLTKTLDDATIRSSLSGFKYELYNTSSKSSPVQIATGVSQTDGRILWTYTVPNYYKNTDDSILLTGTTTYELELPATEKNANGAEVAIQYQVREIKSSIAIAYGNSDIPYTCSTPLTDGKAWNNATDYYYKVVTVSNEAVKHEGVVNNYEYTGLNVKKVVPANNPFDTTKVTFKLYNTDGSKDTLVANGTVDSKGNVTWYRVISSGYGSAPASSVNVINNLPLGHYRIEETWNKDYLDLNDNISILVEARNNNAGWVKAETRTTYTYSLSVDLSDKANDSKATALSVENETLVQEFNLSKVVKVEGDASTIKAELYLSENDASVLVATGFCTTNGIGTYGFTWDYKGTHITRDGLDTLVLPVGKYRVVECCPETYYKDTKIPYTYMTPVGFTATVVNDKLLFYKDFELVAGTYTTLKSTITNVRIEGSFDIIKVERSGDGTDKTFEFNVYYRGNGDKASDKAVLIENVTVITTNGKGKATLDKLPEGWYEIRETGSEDKWVSHWVITSSVENGNKVIRLSSENRTVEVMKIDDDIKENDKSLNAVIIYNDLKPEIGTTLKDRGTDSHVTTYSETAKLVDTVVYQNLMPGHYVASGCLQDKTSGKSLLDKNGNQVTGLAEFDVPIVLDEFGQPIPQSGKVEVEFVVDTTNIEGTVLVAFEEIHEGSLAGDLVAEHKDINDVDQTVVVPRIKTTATDHNNGTHILSKTERVTIDDKVAYEELVIGRTYVVTGTLINAETGKIYTDSDGRYYTATTEFKAEAASGYVILSFNDVLIPHENITLVVFESVSDKEKGVKVAVHEDLTDADQTVKTDYPTPTPTHPPLPQTGETTSSSQIIGVVAVLVGCGIGALIIFRKRKKEE